MLVLYMKIYTNYYFHLL